MPEAAQTGSGDYGDYKRLRLLGGGGQGRVFEAVCVSDRNPHVRLNQTVALKILQRQGSEDKTQRFRRQTAILTALQHPNIVRYIESFIHPVNEWDEDMCLVMEFLAGDDLKSLISENSKGLPWDRTRLIFEQCLEGLIEAAAHGVYHRDLKPSNIFILPHDTVKLIDFGIAHFDDGGATTTGGFKGSFDYMAPDIVLEPARTDYLACDIFSFGVCLYECLTGALPFPSLGENAQSGYIERWRNATPPEFSVSHPTFRVYPGARTLLRTCLAVHRTDRYKSFAQVLDALREVKARRVRHANGDAYEFVEWIGRGGFGEVYRAKRLSDGAPVAVKRLLSDDHAPDRFIREARLLREFRHPHIVGYVDFIESKRSDGRRDYYLVLEYLEGMPGWSLRNRIKKSPAGLPLDEALALFDGYLQALEYLHGRQPQIVHRDIKPGNLYAPEGDAAAAKVFDLGVVRDYSTKTVGEIPGTPEYMPPEFVTQEHRGTPGSDIYSLGLCLYEALTGTPALTPLSRDEKRAWIEFVERSRKEPTIRFTHPVFMKCPELRRIISTALAYKNENRFKSAAPMRLALQAVVRSLQPGEQDGHAGDTRTRDEVTAEEKPLPVPVELPPIPEEPPRVAVEVPPQSPDEPAHTSATGATGGTVGPADGAGTIGVQPTIGFQPTIGVQPTVGVEPMIGIQPEEIKPDGQQEEADKIRDAAIEALRLKAANREEQLRLAVIREEERRQIAAERSARRQAAIARLRRPLAIAAGIAAIGLLAVGGVTFVMHYRAESFLSHVDSLTRQDRALAGADVRDVCDTYLRLNGLLAGDPANAGLLIQQKALSNLVFALPGVFSNEFCMAWAANNTNAAAGVASAWNAATPVLGEAGLPSATTRAVTNWMARETAGRQRGLALREINALVTSLSNRIPNLVTYTGLDRAEALFVDIEQAKSRPWAPLSAVEQNGRFEPLVGQLAERVEAFLSPTWQDDANRDDGRYQELKLAPTKWPTLVKVTRLPYDRVLRNVEQHRERTSLHDRVVLAANAIRATLTDKALVDACEKECWQLLAEPDLTPEDRTLLAGAVAQSWRSVKDSLGASASNAYLRLDFESGDKVVSHLNELAERLSAKVKVSPADLTPARAGALQEQNRIVGVYGSVQDNLGRAHGASDATVAAVELLAKQWNALRPELRDVAVVKKAHSDAASACRQALMAVIGQREPLAELFEDLVTAREQGRVTVQEVQRLTGANRNTIKAHLKALVQKKMLSQEGKGKGTWYRLL